MSKYDPLWQYVKNDGRDSLNMTFEDIRMLTGLDIDTSIIKSKNELKDYGYVVVKISMGEQKIFFKKKCS